MIVGGTQAGGLVGEMVFPGVDGTPGRAAGAKAMLGAGMGAGRDLHRRWEVSRRGEAVGLMRTLTPCGVGHHRELQEGLGALGPASRVPEALPGAAC